MKTFLLSRRAVLRGIGAGSLVTVGLPPLGAMLNSNGNALAAGGRLPVRLVLWGWGHGNNPARWNPTATGTGAAWALTPDLASFEPVKDYVSLLTGTNNPTGGHAGLLGMFKGAGGMTMDQAAGAKPEFDTGSGVRTLELAVSRTPNSDPNYNHIIRGTGGRPLYSNPDPAVAFGKLFGGIAPTTTTPTGPVQPAGPSPWVLDTIKADLERLKRRLGGSDRLRLDEHLTAVNELEKRLRAPVLPRVAGCAVAKGAAAPITLPNDGTLAHDQQMTAKSALISDLVAMAFACDRTRVISIAYTYPAGHDRFSGYGEKEHSVTHGATWPQKGHPLVATKMKALSTLFQKLQAVPEGDTNVLHNSVIFATTDCGDPRAHSGADLPVIIGGHAGGKLKGNVHARGGVPNASSASSTVASVLGLPAGGAPPVAAFLA